MGLLLYNAIITIIKISFSLNQTLLKMPKQQPKLRGNRRAVQGAKTVATIYHPKNLKKTITKIRSDLKLTKLIQYEDLEQCYDTAIKTINSPKMAFGKYKSFNTAYFNRIGDSRSTRYKNNSTAFKRI